AARRGYNLFMPVHLLPRADVRDLAAAYWHGLREHGHDPAARELGLLLPVHVADTTDAARDAARPGFMDYYRVIREVQADYEAWPGKLGDEGPSRAARAPMTFERLCAEAAILDAPDGTVDALGALLAETGATQVLCWMNMGSISHEQVLRSMERFARDVMPRLDVART